MTTKLFSAVALGAVAAFALTAPASAQSGGNFGLTGAAPGVCLINSGVLISQSAVGKAVDARLKQLAAAVSSELSPEKTAIENEDKSLTAAAKAATTAAQQQPLQQRAQALGNRVNNYQQKASQREAELRATRDKALSRIGTEAQPVIRQVANTKACGVVLDTQGVLDANASADITAGVVTALNARISTFTFERENLAAQAGRPAQ